MSFHGGRYFGIHVYKIKSILNCKQRLHLEINFIVTLRDRAAEVSQIELESYFQTMTHHSSSSQTSSLVYQNNYICRRVITMKLMQMHFNLH